MTIETCLFISPRTAPGDDSGFVQQQTDYSNIIKPAVEFSGLSLVSAGPPEAVVDDISDDLIAQVLQADILLVDANRYGPESAAPLSPYLCYFIALRHAFGNRTLLIARDLGHLPVSLRRHHTLAYDPANANQLNMKLKAAITSLRKTADTDQEERVDNPVQQYFHDQQLRAKAGETDRLNAELEKLQQAQSKTRTPAGRIQFVKV
jgi:hypothetical protein